MDSVAYTFSSIEYQSTSWKELGDLTDLWNIMCFCTPQTDLFSGQFAGIIILLNLEAVSS